MQAMQHNKNVNLVNCKIRCDVKTILLLLTVSSTVILNLSLNLQICFTLIKSSRGEKKFWYFLLFVYVSFLMLILICSIMYCSGYSFDSLNYSSEGLKSLQIIQKHFLSSLFSIALNGPHGTPNLWKNLPLFKNGKFFNI